MILSIIKKELAKYDKPENRLNYQRFFKEKLENPVGLKTAVIRRIANTTYKEVKGKRSGEILDICDRLLASKERYMRAIAFEWALKVKKDYNRGEFARFEGWLDKYVDNWASCDSLCCGALGFLLAKFPDLIPKTRKWTRSDNRWFRRASAVCLIASIGAGIPLNKILKRADLLLTDDDDMVQKGYGWMLKEAADEYPDEVFEYVMKHRKTMPRTALRYAIEKFPETRRKQAMSKPLD